MIVGMYMTESVATVAPQSDAGVAAAAMAERGVRRLPVVAGGRLVGIVSKSDLLRAAPRGCNPLAPEARARSGIGFTVEQAMTREVVSIAHDAPVEQAAAMFTQRPLGILPVLRGTDLVGVLSPTDLVRAFCEIVFVEDATRVSIVVGPGVDIAQQALACCTQFGLGLCAYAEHLRDARRYVLLSVRGDPDPLVDALWRLGASVVQVQRPPR